jgi:hypothetical protein
MILDIIIPISLIVTTLLVWFKTEAFEEYATLIGGDKFFKVAAYRKNRERNALLTYHGYLLDRCNSFFIRLATCPYCLGLWLCLTASLLLERFDLVGIYYVGSLLAYGLTSKAMEE